MTDKQNFEKDIDVPSKRLDRIDKMEIDLANYERMERDIEKIIEPYQLDWELDCLSLPSAIQSILERKEQECEELKAKCKKYGEINEQETKDYAELKAENKILKEKFEIAIKNNMDKTLLRLEKGDVQEELQEIREQFGIETLYCHDDNTRVHRCLDVLKLKNTLTEIKEIAERGFKHSQCNCGAKADLDLILQKINECEK